MRLNEFERELLLMFHLDNFMDCEDIELFICPDMTLGCEYRDKRIKCECAETWEDALDIIIDYIKQEHKSESSRYAEFNSFQISYYVF